MKINMRTLLNFKRLLAGSALSALVIISVANPLHAQNVTQGYSTDTPLQRGTIIAIKEGDASKVVPLSKERIDKMHGVIVDANDAPVTLSQDGRKVFVAVNGVYSALVSNENGTINVGDYISISGVNGVGKKADSQNAIVLGKAVDSFDGKAAITSATVNDVKVSIGRIKVDLNVAKNPLAKTDTSYLPQFILKAGEAVAHKPVNPIRIYAGITVLLITSFIAGSLMVSGVRSSMIAIGRNPLSKKTIYKSLIQVILVSLIVFISGLFAVYLLLTI